jgi:hypothetical protein
VSDTVQAKLVELGLLQPDGAGWELTQQVRELLSATLTHPHKSKLAADLLALGMIEPVWLAAVFGGHSRRGDASSWRTCSTIPYRLRSPAPVRRNDAPRQQLPL